jgi:hypothetical protein
MGSKLKKQLEQKQLQVFDMMMSQMQKANAPDPNLERLKASNNAILDWYSPTAYKDIYQHPTLANQLDPLKIALSDRDSNRVGTGLLGSSGAASAYTKDMALDRNFKRRLAGAGMLDEALRGEYDKSSSALAQLSGADVQRQNSAMSGMGTLNESLQGKIKQLNEGGFWKGVLGGILGGVKGTVGSWTI